MIKFKNKHVETEMPVLETQSTGLKRFLTQVGDTITFEVGRNLRIFTAIFIIYLVVFILTLVSQEFLFSQLVPLPEDPIDYIKTYLGYIGFLIMLSSVGFAGSIIAEDFQRQTCDLLFPKISKLRLLLGRTLARFGLITICLIFYYILIASITFIRYLEVPIVIWHSFGWALMYAFMLFSFVTLMSSFTKSTALSIVISLVLLLIVLSSVMSVFVLFLKIEPLFIPLYYESIITASMKMPPLRYLEETINLGMGAGGENLSLTLFTWLTPDYFWAFTGMLLFIISFQALAIFFYRRRQSKS